MMFGELILVLLVLGVVVWAIIKVVPDWQNRIGLDSMRCEIGRSCRILCRKTLTGAEQP